MEIPRSMKIGKIISKDNEMLDLYGNFDLKTRSTSKGLRGLHIDIKIISIQVKDNDGKIVDEYDIDERYLMTEKYVEVVT